METYQNAPATYRDEHLTFDFANGSACIDMQSLVLTRKEQELLAMLLSNEGEIVPRDVLLEKVWGYNPACRTRTLDVHIRRVRRKLGAFGDQYIETIFGVGYRFQRYRAPRLAPAFVRPFALATA